MASPELDPPSEQPEGSSIDYAALLAEAQQTSDQAPPGYKGKHAEIKRKRAWLPRDRRAQAEFKARMFKMMTEIQDPYDEKVVLGLREGRELINNDGRTTYIVHSTTPERAQAIIKEGLTFRGEYGRTEVPSLRETAVMLAAPDEEMASERNIHNLAYRYGDEYSSIKLVYEFDQPNPHTSLNENPFENTFLSQADGTNIQQLSTEGTGKYLIPPTRLKGYFDLNAEQFVSKEQIDQALAQPEQ